MCQSSSCSDHIAMFERGLFGTICFRQTVTPALPHSLELSQCLQTSQQTLPHHPAVARQHCRSRFQWEQSHERLHMETASQWERVKNETSIKFWWRTSARIVISPFHLGYQGALDNYTGGWMIWHFVRKKRKKYALYSSPILQNSTLTAYYWMD